MTTKTRKTLKSCKTAGHKPQVVRRRAREVLQELIDFDTDIDADEYDGEIVCEGGQCWFGATRIARRTVDELLRACLLHADDFGGKVERFTINESGRRLCEGLPPYRDREGNFHDTLAGCM